MKNRLVTHNIPAPRGLVRTGLVCAYDFSKRNLLPYSEPLLAQVLSKSATVTQASFVEGDLSNGIQFPAAAQADYAYLPYGGFKLNSDYTVSVYVVMDDGSVPVVGANTATGDFCVNVEGIIATNLHPPVWVAGNLYRVSAWMNTGATIGSTSCGIVRYATQSGKGFRVTGYMLNEGTYPLTYEATTDNQTLVDRWINGYNGQLGSTAGSDVNDPTWTGIGLTYGADDYVKIAAAANINDLAQITIMSVINLAGWGGAGLGRPSSKLQRYLCVVDAALGYFQDFDGASDGAWTSAASSLALATPVTVAVTYDRTSAANDPKFYINGALSATSETSTPVGSATSDAASDLYLGNSSSAIRNLDGVQGYYLEYNRILTPAEIMRNHNYLKAEMARRGLSIA